MVAYIICILREVIKNIAYRIFRYYISIRIWKAKKCFKRAKCSCAWLTWEDLYSLQKKYALLPAQYYKEAKTSSGQRANERVKCLLNSMSNQIGKLNTFLEAGCYDGMMCFVLQRLGKQTTGIDNNPVAFSREAEAAGVRLMHMDVEKLKFDDRSFDFVFSYNAFEHFANPELALREMMRVTKVNGYIYLNFAPLYMSPFGLHAYDFITIPYCQFLFSEELFKKFAKLHGLGGGDFLFVNKWSLEDYRRLWDRYSRDLRKVKYYEHYDITYLELIITYASCFKHKTNYFENLVVSNIEVLFKKLI